jgi:hypothetical protein
VRRSLHISLLAILGVIYIGVTFLALRIIDAQEVDIGAQVITVHDRQIAGVASDTLEPATIIAEASSSQEPLEVLPNTEKSQSKSTNLPTQTPLEYPESPLASEVISDLPVQRQINDISVDQPNLTPTAKMDLQDAESENESEVESMISGLLYLVHGSQLEFSSRKSAGEFTLVDGSLSTKLTKRCGVTLRQQVLVTKEPENKVAAMDPAVSVSVGPFKPGATEGEEPLGSLKSADRLTFSGSATFAPGFSLNSRKNQLLGTGTLAITAKVKLGPASLSLGSWVRKWFHRYTFNQKGEINGNRQLGILTKAGLALGKYLSVEALIRAYKIERFHGSDIYKFENDLSFTLSDGSVGILMGLGNEDRQLRADGQKNNELHLIRGEKTTAYFGAFYGF